MFKTGDWTKQALGVPTAANLRFSQATTVSSQDELLKKSPSVNVKFEKMTQLVGFLWGGSSMSLLRVTPYLKLQPLQFYHTQGLSLHAQDPHLDPHDALIKILTCPKGGLQ